MKKVMKRLVAVIFAATMIMTLFAGCTKSTSSASGMFDVAKKASELTKCTYEMVVDANVAGTAVQATLSGKKDGNATSVSAKVSVSGMVFNLEDAIIFTDDVMYIHVSEILDEFSSFLALSGVDVSEYGLDMEWLAIDAEGLFESKTGNVGTYTDELDEAYKDLIKTEDGAYVISVSSKEDYEKLIAATKTMIEDNQKDWTNQVLKQYEETEAKLEKLVDTYADIFVEAFAQAASDLGYELSDEEIAEYKDEILEEMNMPEISYDESQVTKMFEEILSSLETADASELEGVLLKISTKMDKNVYTMSVDMAAEDSRETAAVSIKTVITADDSVSVAIPENAVNLAEKLPALMSDFFLNDDIGFDVPSTGDNDNGDDDDYNYDYPEDIDGLVVGTDLEAGEYVLIINEDAYSASYSIDEDGKEVEGDFFYNNYLVRLEEGQTFGYSDCTLYKRGEVTLDTTKSGMFEVGVDLEAGEYTIVPNDDADCIFYAVYEGLPCDWDHLLTNNFLDEDELEPVDVALTNGQIIYLEFCHIQ